MDNVSKQFTKRLVALINRLSTYSSRYENIRTGDGDPIVGEDYVYWRVIAGLKGSQTSRMTEIYYYPGRKVCEGYTSKSYTTKSLESVVSRVRRMFS